MCGSDCHYCRVNTPGGGRVAVRVIIRVNTLGRMLFGMLMSVVNLLDLWP